MNKIVVFLIISVTAIQSSYNQTYPINEIPDDLLLNAKAVIRDYNTEFTIESKEKAKLKIYLAVTILNENGHNNSIFVEMYDNFRRISGIKGTVYDKDGKKIKKIKREDILDYAAISGGSIYDDNRVKVIDPEIKTYPYTVVYEHEVALKGLLYFPKWSPISGNNVSVQKAQITIIPLNDIKFTYKERNLNNECIQGISDEGFKQFQWVEENLPAITKEKWAYEPSIDKPTLFLKPDKFLIDGYEGTTNSWKDFGVWVSKLNNGKQELLPETIEDIKKIISDINDIHKIVDTLYSYMQNRTRYVSVQVGIGGWQPFEASTVHRLGYGDCKALSNYMNAILNVAGIKSHYVLIQAGSNNNEIIEDFPSTQFNHAILCVPTEQDTIWLECTSQTNPCGYLGTFTDNRKALVITSNGGVLVNTPEYSLNDNVRFTKIQANLDENTNLKLKIDRTYQGIYYSGAERLVLMEEEDRRKKIYNNIDLPNFQLVNYNYERIKSPEPNVTEELDLNVHDYGTKMGNVILINPNILNRWDYIPSDIFERQSDIQFRHAKNEVDSIIIEIPGGFQISQIPDNVALQSEFGSCTYSYMSRDDKLIFIRNWKIIDGVYPKAKYAELKAYLEKIKKQDNIKIAIKKVT